MLKTYEVVEDDVDINKAPERIEEVEATTGLGKEVDVNGTVKVMESVEDEEVDEVEAQDVVEDAEDENAV